MKSTREERLETIKQAEADFFDIPEKDKDRIEYRCVEDPDGDACTDAGIDHDKWLDMIELYAELNDGIDNPDDIDIDWLRDKVFTELSKEYVLSLKDRKLAEIREKLRDGEDIDDLSQDDVDYIVSLATEAQITNHQDGVAWEQWIDVTDDSSCVTDHIVVRWLPNATYREAAEKIDSERKRIQSLMDEDISDSERGSLQDEMDSLSDMWPEEDQSCDWDSPDAIELK